MKHKITMRYKDIEVSCIESSKHVGIKFCATGFLAIYNAKYHSNMSGVDYEDALISLIANPDMVTIEDQDSILVSYKDNHLSIDFELAK